MNDRAYRNGETELGAGVFEVDEPEDPICPSCTKVTSVQAANGHWWCTDCDLVFEAGDHHRVSPTWVKGYRELRQQQGRPRDEREAS